MQHLNAEDQHLLNEQDSYYILNKLPKKDFDALIRLACHICNTPLALIKFINGERRWATWQNATAISQGTVDEVFTLINEHQPIPSATISFIHTVQFHYIYAVPLITPYGRRIGCLCVAANSMRTFTAAQEDALITLADEIVYHLEAEKRNAEIAETLAGHQEISNMFDLSAELHCILDRKATVRMISKSAEKLLGYKDRESLGRPIWLFLPEDEKLRILPQIEQGLASGRKYFEIETRIKTKYNDVKWVGWTLTAANRKWFAHGRDITYQKHVVTELEQLSLVASKVNNGIVINDAEGRVLWVNEGFERITGYGLNDVKGLRSGDIISGKDTDFAVIEQARAMRTNKRSFAIDVLGYKKSGEPLWLSVNNTVIVDDAGQVDREIEIIIDITERKLAEQQLVIARQEALKLSRTKEIFYSVLSHEMRTPLNAVLGMANILIDDNPTSGQLENLNILKFSAQNLLMLINDVLDFSKIESGNMVLEQVPLNLKELALQTANTVRLTAINKGLKLLVDTDPRIPEMLSGDTTRVYQILANLLGNSVKFTAAGEVKLSLVLLSEDESSAVVHFQVSDTGIGIAADKLEYIFETYSQANRDTSRKYGGTGLGLAITRALIELHHSQIKVQSEVGKGSVFSFTIRFQRAQKTFLLRHPEQFMPFLNQSVLIVDDNEINLMLTEKILSKWGLQTATALDGEEAVAKIRKNIYSLILMDLQMPVMGGIEAAQIIRSLEDEYYKQLPIVVFTASVAGSDHARLRASGINDYLLKPFNPADLYRKISAYLHS